MITIRHFTAAKGLISYNGKILLLRESGKYIDGMNAGQYDVPGGRLNLGEDLLKGLSREIFEESGIKISMPKKFFINNVTVKKHGQEWHIERNYFSCQAQTDQVQLSSDHDHYLWVDPTEYQSSNIIENLHEVFVAYNSL